MASTSTTKKKIDLTSSEFRLDARLFESDPPLPAFSVSEPGFKRLEKYLKAFSTRATEFYALGGDTSDKRAARTDALKEALKTGTLPAFLQMACSPPPPGKCPKGQHCEDGICVDD